MDAMEKMKTRFKEMDEKVKAWVAQQSPPVEVALVTLGSALQGGVIGVLMGTFTSDMAMPAPPPGGAATPEAQQAMKQMQALTGGPWLQARNFAVMTGVNAGISCALRRARNLTVDDVQTSMAAAFGSGMAFSLISGVGGTVPPAGATVPPNPVVSMISTGVVFALFQGAFFQAGKLVSGGAASSAQEALEFKQTTSMLRGLGLQKYEKNFKKGMLNDRTLPLLNDSALQDVKIPPGPRLLILDHLKRSTQEDDSTDDAVPSAT